MKRTKLVFAVAAAVLLVLSACQPQTVIVEKEVRVTEVVKEVVKETVVVEGTPKVVEKEVTKVVEAVVTATPEPTQVSSGGTVIESSFSDAEILNPLLSTDTASEDVEDMLFDGLVDIDVNNLSPVSDLAEDWEISDDNLTFTFYLRNDVTWHDGEPFTARDVKFTYDTILDPDVNSPRRADIADVLTRDQIEVLDDYTIRFTLSQVDASFLVTKCSYGIIPEHILGGLTPDEFNTAEFNTQSPIGTGAFMFREWVKDDHVALVKNPDYFKGAPNIDFWYYKIVENQTVEYAQLQTGEVDFAGVTAALWEDAQQQENLGCVAYPQFAFTFYVYQLDPEKSPLFLDVRTRQALLLALDRQAMVDSIVFGLADVAHSTVPPISWAHNPDNEPRYGYDPEAAKALLDEAGWRDEDGDGVREAHGVTGVDDGTPFTFEIHTNAGNNERESNMVVMQQYWKEIGVDAKSTPIEWNALLAELTETYEYEMIVVGFSWDTDPDQKTMWHTDSYGGGFNMNRYSNPDLDKIIDAALQTVDQEERTEYYFEMQRILAEDVPAPILYFRQGTGCWNTRFHEFEWNDIDEKWNAEKWWVDR
jgi:peptide/nickel transport system substrate-binding protein